MDNSTELVIRALIQGLYGSGAITSDHTRAVISALKDAAGAAMDRHDPETAKHLIALCKGIRADNAIPLHESA